MILRYLQPDASTLLKQRSYNEFSCSLCLCGLRLHRFVMYSPHSVSQIWSSHVFYYVLQTTLQTRRKYSLLDTSGSVSETFFFLRREERKADSWSSDHKSLRVFWVNACELKLPSVWARLFPSFSLYLYRLIAVTKRPTKGCVFLTTSSVLSSGSTTNITAGFRL